MFARFMRSHPIIVCALVGLLILLCACAWIGSSADDSPSEPSAPSADAPTARPRPTTRPRPTSEAAPTTVPANSAPAGQADWTVLVYLDGDNNLESDAIGDFAEMASVGSSDALNIIVQMDRVESSEDWDDTSNGDWNTVKRFRVEKRKKPVASNQLADLGERNMGDPRVLADFASWGIKTYPAKHYALIFWDHGASWPGVASDDTSDGDMLTLPELARALGDVQKNTGVQKLDLIGFDACLMAQVDVLKAVAPYGDVAIGSADLEPGEGWAWNAWLNDLAKKPAIDGAALAPSIIKSFSDFYKKEGDSSVTLAAFDLNKVDQITQKLDALARAMIDTMPASYKAIGKARAHAAEYASGDTDISAIDLGYFADSLAKAGGSPQVTSAARALSRTISDARIVQGNGADHPNASGMSVYFPWKKKNYDSDYTNASPLTKATRWDSFLQTFYKGNRGSSARASLALTPVQQTIASASAPLNLQATTVGSDTAYVSYFIGRSDPSNADTITILSQDYIYPPGAASNGDIPNWLEGDQVKLSWKASSWYLSNGSDVILAPFTPIEYGASSYSVRGSYTASTTGKQTPVQLEFSISQGRGTLQHIWAFDKAGSANPRPRELKPRAGDTFTPELLTYTPSTNEFTESAGSGPALTFGDQPLQAFAADAPDGEYTVGLTIENVAGEIADQYTDVTVANNNSGALPAIPAAVPAPQTGANAGTLAFHDDDYGFGLDYPADWKTTTPTDGKIVFANADAPEQGTLAVDVYELDGGLAAANRAIIRELLDTDGNAPGFAIRQDISDVMLSGHAGKRIEYVYEDSNGTLIHTVGVAISDSTLDATYLVTYAAPEASFASAAARFEQMLASFRLG